MKVRFYDIKWDTDETEIELPSELTLEVDDEDGSPDALNEFGADLLSDEKGYCVESFSWQTLPKSGMPLSCFDNTD